MTNPKSLTCPYCTNDDKTSLEIQKLDPRNNEVAIFCNNCSKIFIVDRTTLEWRKTT